MDGRSTLRPDTILYALGMRSASSDELKITAGDLPIDIIGDAIKPCNVDQAISSAYHAAVNIGKI